MGKKYAIDAKNISTIDINNDDFPEILISSNAPMCEMPLDYYDHPERFDTSVTYFEILQADGRNFYINDRKMSFEFENGFHETIFCYLPEVNGILLGTNVRFNEKPIPLRLLNLSDGIITDLPYEFIHLIHIEKTKDRINLISIDENDLIKTSLDFNFKIRMRSTIRIPLSKLNFVFQTKLLGKSFYLFDPFTIKMGFNV
jgi:hypothetical protein